MKENLGCCQSVVPPCSIVSTYFHIFFDVMGVKRVHDLLQNWLWIWICFGLFLDKVRFHPVILPDLTTTVIAKT